MPEQVVEVDRRQRAVVHVRVAPQDVLLEELHVARVHWQHLCKELAVREELVRREQREKEDHVDDHWVAIEHVEDLQVRHAVECKEPTKWKPQTIKLF